MSSVARIPQLAELDDAGHQMGLAHEKAEWIVRNVRAARNAAFEGTGEVPISAAEAWHVTEYARNLRRDAEGFLDWAKELEHDVEWLWSEQSPAARRDVRKVEDA
jgi:hypothetical protein